MAITSANTSTPTMVGYSICHLGSNICHTIIATHILDGKTLAIQSTMAITSARKTKLMATSANL